MSLDLCKAYMKLKQLFGDKQFKDIKELKKELIKYFAKNKQTDWSYAGCKTTYNNIIIFKILGFQVTVSLTDNKGVIEICYDTESIHKIFIRIQDFFHWKVVSWLKRKSKKEEILKKYFIDDNLVDSEEVTDISPITENSFIDPTRVGIEKNNKCDNKTYRVDMCINICGEYNICLEFFENHHFKKDDPMLQYEKQRILNLVFNNQTPYQKVVHVAVFWQKHISDKIVFNSFMENILRFIENFTDINNEKKYITTAIQKEIGCDLQLAEVLYDANENKNIPVISLDSLDKITQWKDKEKGKKKLINKFVAKVQQFESIKKDIEIDELGPIESDNDFAGDDSIQSMEEEKKVYYDPKTNQVSNYGLALYISYLITSNLLEPENEAWWNEFNAKITRAFINGLKQIRTDRMALTDNYISGLNDCYKKLKVSLVDK